MTSKGDLTRWPSHFPTGCPPSDARKSNASYYRLVITNPPSATECVSKWIQLNGRGITDDRACQSCGLSIFGDIRDAERLQKSVPGFRTYQVATVNLNDSAGKVKP